jgi:TRAP transporter TAXI family solute receptor
MLNRIGARPKGRCGAVLAAMLACLAIVGFGVHGAAAQARAAAAAAPAAVGFAVNKPVIAAACTHCPFGALAKILKVALQDTGYDLQICFQCAGPTGATLVADKRLPPPRTTESPVGAALVPQPPPNGPMDIGITTPQWLLWTYNGAHDYAKQGPRRNLRLIASLQDPKYLIVAATVASGITDLSQAKGRPVRVLVDGGTMSDDVLAHYGMSRKSIEAAGGTVRQGIRPETRKDFDLVIFAGTLNNVPEFNVWYEVSQRFDLHYLHLPAPLLDQLAKTYSYQRRDIPDGLLRGLNEAIPSIATNTINIFGRDDTPDDFAYALAKAIDQHKELLAWNIDATSYNPQNVWRTLGVPLHPGAARYYREVGYMK